MSFIKKYTVNASHIDVQGIVDGLYYPFYMEWCRHDYIREILGFDFEEEAEKGVHMVLSSYEISFLRSLKKDDSFDVTCELFADAARAPRLHFKQEIIMNNKVMTRAIFTGTCVPAKGGRPYLPESLHSFIEKAPELGGK
ncbi:acyl-CoA thioesterase [Mucilaginibacter sp.]